MLILHSLWGATSALPSFPFLAGDVRCDILIIGAGLTGINCGYILQEAGADVLLIDKGEIGSGITMGTTGKISLQHGSRYDRLLKKNGPELASQYLEANRAGQNKYLEIIAKENVSCDLEENPSYLYSLDDPSTIEDEVKTCEELHLPITFLTETPLPIEIAAAAKMEGQYAFHPLRYLAALAAKLKIFTHTRAIAIDGHEVKTDHGTIHANQIILACHYPFINAPGYYFMRMYQSRAYILTYANVPNLRGMYIDEKTDGFSFRNWKDLLLFAGEDHRTGKNQEGGRYEKLRKTMADLYPQGKEVYAWSNQDCVPLDDIPYVGPFSLKMPNVYIATGFNKWGITNSMGAALLLCDLIQGRPNPWSEVFSPQRQPTLLPLFNLGFTSAGSLLRQKLYIPRFPAAVLAPGRGGIVEYKGEKYGIYRDESGKLFPVKAKCSHLGCQLEWNPDEKSWDCPCHGSRFDYHGQVLNQPAQVGLKDNG